MHEVALSRGLAAAVARASGGRRVRSVQVTVGALRQVVPEALTYAWGFVVRETPLADAELVLTCLPAVVVCDDCQSQSTLGAELGFDCRSCGSSATTVVSGEEFTLTAIDVDEKGPEDGTLPPPR